MSIISISVGSPPIFSRKAIDVHPQVANQLGLGLYGDHHGFGLWEVTGRLVLAGEVDPQLILGIPWLCIAICKVVPQFDS